MEIKDNNFEVIKLLKKTFILFLAVLITGCTPVTNISTQTNTNQTTLDQPAYTANVTQTNTDDTTDINNPIIEEGKGIDGIVIGETSQVQAIKELGEGYKIIEYNEGFTDVVYEKKGITLCCDDDQEKTILSILFVPPNNYKTTKGIVVGINTMKDVIEKYGRPNWLTDDDSDTWWVEYSGINYHVEYDKSAPKYPLDENKYLDKPICKIELTCGTE